METYHRGLYRQKQLRRLDDFSPRSHAGCYHNRSIRTKNSYWLVNVSSVWVVLQQVEVSGHDVFDQCVWGIVRQHQRNGRLSIGHI